MYWVPHKELSWLPGTRKQGSDVSVTFDCEGGEVVQVPTAQATELSLVQPDQLEGVDDVCSLGSVHEGALLHTVRVRYFKDLIYTRVARTLIAVNPFALLPIYTSQQVDRYASAADSTELPPHIYGIGQDAMQGLRSSKRNQAVLISGESGAGKTESAKLILAFVADAVRSNGEDGDGVESEGLCKPLEDRVLQTNAVLEAFGNAMTARNNNSSRFGKWLDLRFSSELGLLGCSLTSYLLETTRVCKQETKERGFHVFYQLLQARGQHAFKDLHLAEPKKYRYLKDGQLTAPGIDDGRCFTTLCEALADLGFSENARSETFRIVSGVLALGNVDFTASGEGDTSQIEVQETLAQAAELLGMTTESLEQCVTIRKIVIAGDVTKAPLRLEQARSARDSLARLLYGRLFLWLISCMNDTFHLTRGEDASPTTRHNNGERLLGVLDIAGFESFGHNSLEQLLINLSNEHLHQRFNEFIFKNEVEESNSEGIQVPSSVNFTDNADILSLIDSRGGILDLLDETMIVPKATDMAFVTKALKQHEKDKHLVAPRVSKCAFGIAHFAGEVTYTCDGWLEKNADRPPDDAVELLLASKLEVLQELGECMSAEAAEAGGGSTVSRGGKRKAKSVSAVFRSSLKALMEKIAVADPHYVLCVKPNMQKVPRRFDGVPVMEQLILTGVLTAVQIRQQGYAYRIPHADFAFEYRCVVDTSRSPTVRKSKAPTKAGREDTLRMVEALPEILKDLGHDVGADAFAVGYTKVFFKFAAYKPLQDARRVALWSSAAIIQRVFRGFLARRRAAERRHVLKQMRALLTPLLGAGSVTVSAASAQRVRVRTASFWPAGESLLSRLSGSPEELEKQAASIVDGLSPLLEEAAGINFRGPDVVEAQRVSKRLGMELDLAKEVGRAQSSLDPVEVERILSRARAVGLPGTERLDALDKRISRLRAQLPLHQALKTAMVEGLSAETLTDEQERQLQEIADAAEAAGLRADLGGGEAWLPELAGGGLLQALLDLLAERDKKRQQAEQAAEAEKQAAEAEARRAEEAKRAEEMQAEAAQAVKDGDARARAEAAAALQLKQELLKQAKEASTFKNEGGARVGRRRVGLMEVPGGAKTGNVRKTVTGLEVAEQVKILSALKRACDEYDIEALEKLLLEATKHGMEETCKAEVGIEGEGESKFGLETARNLYRQLQGEDFILKEIERAREEAAVPVAPVMALRRLQHLSHQLRTVPGHEDEAQDTSRFLQKTLASYSKDTCQRKTVFDSTDPEELDLATQIFGDLSKYSRLKPANLWMSRLRQGRSRALSTFVRRRKNTGKLALPVEEKKEEGMMLHGKAIAESLTWPPDDADEEDYDAAATQNFRNVLVAMGDRPAQECQRVASRDAVVMLAKCDPQMLDEVYMQSLKQMIKNPVSRSVSHGWELLYHLMKEVPPKDELREFVYVFITRGVEQMEPSAVSFFYALRLSRLLGCRDEFDGDGKRIIRSS